MIITGLLLFLIGTNLSYSYPSSIRYEKPCSPLVEDVDRVSENKMPCHANNKVRKELPHPCDAQNIQDNTIIDEPVTVEDIPCPRESEEQTYIPAEIPPAPVLPPFKLSESPIVVEDVEIPENEEITQPCEEPESLSIDIGEKADPCSPEITNEDEEISIIPTNLPTPPELPPLVSFSEDEDCENNDDVLILPSREPSQALKLPSQSHDVEEENIPCPTETSEEDEKESLILPNIPTPPEMPPLVPFSEEEDCENNDDVLTLPSREPTQALKLPSQTHDIEEENIPCPTETSEDNEKETPILNIPTPPELPPLVSFSEEEDCENNDDVLTLPSREPTQALKLPSKSHDIEEENIPCPTETSEDDEKETPILPNLPTPPELPPLVSFSEEEDCENNDDVLTLPSREPTQALKLPPQTHDIEEEDIPCPKETVSASFDNKFCE